MNDWVWMTERPQKITFAEMRDMGVRGLLVYCADYRCSHSIAISGDGCYVTPRKGRSQSAACTRAVLAVAARGKPVRNFYELIRRLNLKLFEYPFALRGNALFGFAQCPGNTFVCSALGEAP
jgi:hypothetical protein